MGKVIEHHHTLEFVEILVMDHLKRGLAQKSHPFRNMVVSTVESDRPESRLVVVRDMQPKPFQITFYTDYRSSKIDALAQNQAISFLFWHPSSRLQVRLRANAAIHHASERALSFWKQLGVNAKASYSTKKSPGTRLDGNAWEVLEVTDPASDENFAVVTAIIEEMDVLQLSRSGHIRAHFLYENGIRSKQHFLVP